MTKSSEKTKPQKRTLRSKAEPAIRLFEELFTNKHDKNKDNEYLKEFNRFREKILVPQKKSKYTKTENQVFVMIGLIILHLTILISRYLYAFFTLQTRIVSLNVIYLILAATIPFLVWVKATDENYWVFYRRKMLFFLLCVFNATLTLFQPVYTLVSKIGLIIVEHIPTNPLLTGSMTLLIGQCFTSSVCIVISVLIYIECEPLILSEKLRNDIKMFQLQNVIDEREDREYKYDSTIIKDLETGKPIVTKERDRTLQTSLVGGTGTGKSTTIFEGTNREDMDQKVKNREKREEEFLRMIEKGQAYIKGPLREFSEYAIEPKGNTKAEIEKNKKAIEKIRKKYPDCGITIVAPNATMIENEIRMAKARDIQVNVVDPVNNFSHYENVKTMGINPFYLPLGLKEEERVNRLSEGANIFSEVLIATNQMGGESDQYFTDISLAVSSNVSAIVMLAKNIEGKQAYFDDVQECITNFESIKPYVSIIENEFGITVEASAYSGPKGGQKADPEQIAKYIQENYNNKTAPAQRGKAAKNPYYYQILFVKQELLGAGAEAMFSQARGLRNLISKIANDSRIKRKLSAQGEERLDFDKMLSENQITVVNTALELGQNTSTSFGLFFMLLMRASVFRRPMHTRTPHFFKVDECAQYIHPFFDDVVALYRQYNVPAILTLQTLTQLKKRSSTAYLQNVFLGAGTQIVFGRLGPEEMKLFSEMSGVIREDMEQKTVTESSVFSANPNYSEGVRTTPNIANRLEGADLRIRGFLELTVFTIDNGRTLPGQLGRVFFVGEDAYEEVPHTLIEWKQIAPEAFVWKENGTNEDSNDGKTAVFETTKGKDAVPKDAEVLDILRVSMPKEEVLETAETDTLSLNDFYLSLIGQGNHASADTEDNTDTEDDIDYAAANRALNKRR